MVSEIQALDMPNVAPDLAGQLKAELLRVISEHGTGKLASGPPLTAKNQVQDLTAVDNGTGGVDLAWTYLCVGTTTRTARSTRRI